MRAVAAETGWVVVLPIKGGADAKSRLGLGPELAAAMAADCRDAVMSTALVRRVVVVTADRATASSALASGAEVVDQPAARGGLAGAVGVGLEAAGADGPVAVLLADLPALRPEHLGVALADVELILRTTMTAFVPDLDGEGTVLLAGRVAADLEPRFGAGSAGAHERAGAVRVALDLPGLRRDVDTADDLAAAVALGVGPRTARTLGAMQATVLRYDPDAGTGEVVTDDGLRLPMAAGATDGSGLRHLRPGQRVSCEPVGSGLTAVTHVRVRGVGE